MPKEEKSATKKGKLPKKKKCKNTSCGILFQPWNSLAKTCSPSCALAHARDAKEREYKRETRRRRLELNRKDLSWQKKQTQIAFNKMRVLEELKWFSDRGLDPTCISCGNGLGNDQWSCGHFKTVGAQSNLRFDRKNTYLQHNVNCNKHLSGDIYGTKNTRGYINGLMERFGEEEGKAIIEYCETNTKPRKWACEELESMRKEFNKRIRELQWIKE